MRQAEIHWGPPSRAITAAGPRRCEELLLSRLDELFAEHGRQVLARPIRVVVPSKSLRLHVLERLLAHRGRAVAGLDCRTHHGLAVSIAERAGERAAISTDLFPLFARRLAHEETPLRRTLFHLKDGYASVLASVRDLLEAGLDPAHVEALEEVLEAEGPKVATPFEIERAQSLVRLAARTSATLADENLGRSSHLLAAATGLIKEAPDMLPTSAVVVYGYNDATGLTADFLLALVQVFGGDVLLDDPPDPIAPTRADSGVRFARSYRERIASTLPSERYEADVERAEVDVFRAVGTDAEVREAGRRIRELLDAGSPPERIGVVTRRLGAYRRAVRTHFDRLGIAFSGVARSGPSLPSAFRVGALVEILKQQDQVPIERWLDACQLTHGLRNDLELGLHALGIARLSEAARLDARRYIRTARGDAKGSDRGLPLPVRTGLDAGGGEPRATHRYLETARIEEAVERANHLCRALTSWRKLETLGEHLGALDSLVGEHLGWDGAIDVRRSFEEEIEAWVRGIPPGVALDFHEFATLLSYRMEAFGSTDLGGKGGGVQVLDVVEARSRTFDHLFLLGLNRGVFPRVIQEDPLLPDRLREVISRHGFGVLPDLQRKLPGFDEERYLFAQLLASSPRATISWLDVDDEHALRTPSPLIERLRWSRRAPDAALREPPAAAPIYSLEPAEAPRTALENAVVAGIHGTREQFGAVLEVAGDEARRRFGTGPEPELTGIHLRVLDEIDPQRGTKAGETAYSRLGPYFGFVGPDVEASDPRRREKLFVTTLEQVARCPWRTFVERVLRVERLPDPLEVLPGVSPLLVGNLVHKVLESIVDGGLEAPVANLDEARSAEGQTIRWPDAEDLERLLLRSARSVAFEQGITLSGFDRVLASVCRKHLEIAEQLDWIDSESRFSILASELYGDVDWPAPKARIGFKADRVDRNSGRLIFTDYKTGKGPRTGRYKASDRKLLLEGLRSGEWLQAALYARAGGGDEDAGRYLFVGPSFEKDQNRELVLRANDAEAAPLLDRAIEATLGSWQSGTFFPRLVLHDQNAEPMLCQYCDVAEACLRGDSGARGRLRSWTGDRRGAEGAAGSEDAVLRTWYLRDPTAYAPAEEDGE